ncbi:MAG: hypothetical protein RL291_1895 [Pseudomonadota bacterium]
MFQTFDAPAPAAATLPRIKALRAKLASHGLDAVIVPRADEHQGEYVPACAERLKWLTGFSGSAGSAIIAARAAALLVDGRYTLQAKDQVETSVFEIVQVPPATMSEWLKTNLKQGATVGFDPALHTIAEIARLTDALAVRGITLKATPKNLVDEIWGTERPAPPQGRVRIQPDALTGQPFADKIETVQKALKDAGQDAVLLTQPDSISWLFNIRGRDVAHNPVVLAFAVVPVKGKPSLFIDDVKLDSAVKRALKGVIIAAPRDLTKNLKDLKKAKAKVRVDEASAGYVFKAILGASLVNGADPCLLPKARKTSAELVATREAHVRDGAAMVRFLAWFDREAPQGHLDEISICKKLEDCRRATNKLEDISFDTISGSGPHGAIVHYRVTEATNRTVKPGELFLLDSGGQYQDGTTDITRTISVGVPTSEMRERYTLVLKAHIAVATARFPKNTPGIQIDALARAPLWARGLDYDHGTGHGVGAFLSVHEGPQSISRRGTAASLEPGMICSNEPGFYKEGAYGIRLENLVIVTEPETPKGGDREMLGFETITLAPFDRRLVVADLLTPAERQWLDQYHARVKGMLQGLVEGPDRQWLIEATRAI